jgi:hypothetical protein
MARRKKRDDGEQPEQLTVRRTMRLTPSQAAELDAGADKDGVCWSDLARELMFRRSAARPAGIGPADILALRNDLNSAGRANTANGNLLNQIARHANTTGELGAQRLAELDAALARFNEVNELHKLALHRVFSL